MQSKKSPRFGTIERQFLIAGLAGCLAAAMLASCGLTKSAPEPTPAFTPSLPVDRLPAGMSPLRFDGMTPAEPQPAPDALQPGLATIYFYEFFKRNVDDLPVAGSVLEVPGKPVLEINHQFADGPVFGSGARRGVGMRMTGFIELPEPGTYRFRALSNDGVRIYLDGRLIIEDPDVHADRLSVPAAVSVKKGGWYQLKVEYFQRKGTAALGFFWRRPSVDAYRPVPASAYGHIPD